MQASLSTQLLLPAVLGLIMFGMGLSLTRADFIRLLSEPKVVMAGVIGQVILLPVLALAVAKLTNLSPAMSVGLMILAACPGGTTSNIFSQLSGANLALSVSLTAATTIICVFTTPWLIEFSLTYFQLSQSVDFSLFTTSLSLLVIMLVPMTLGLYFRRRWENAALRLIKPFQRLSLIFLVVMIISISVQEFETLKQALGSMFWSTVGLNVIAIIAGLLLAVAVKADRANSLTLGIEIGIQNASLAILIALTFLKESELAIPAGVYGVTMYLGTGVLLFFLGKDKNVSNN
ncbi:bile acid:sodium symporter family protein [Thalassotalea sp. M1531]|uniref:Bile acid:sodium symporter family protein n=1 Tax=Thalassotalea algicola TaxID=2716224 RepID=A0A7Y0LC29_9GAMM|nr:bile acid:sodium symporter family protein [Thalassotalea algicola]NMP30340.1 bile acid:sodium symporter family protein [Thalassotalea algicola]